MLILSRRLDESVKIGDDVTVTVLGVRGGQVRLGIKAPRSVPVDRKEVRDQKKCQCDFDPTHGGSPPCPVHDEKVPGPFCAVCDHIEELHNLPIAETSSHPFTPKPPMGG